MKLRKLWVLLGGCACMTAAFVVQRVCSQEGPPLPALPPAVPTVPMLPAAAPMLPGVPALPPPSAGIPQTPPALPGFTPEQPVNGPFGATTNLPTATPPMPILVPPASPGVPATGQWTGVPKSTLPEVPPTDVVKTPETVKAPESVGNIDAKPGKQDPAVSVEWVAPAGARLNQPIGCSLLVRNTSQTPAQNVTVRAHMPQGLVVRSSEPAAKLDQGDLTWNLGTLAGGQSRRIEVNVTAQSRGDSQCSATVTFSTATSHQVTVREPLLQVKMKAPESILVGEKTLVLVAIHNPGDGLTENIRVRVVMPEGLEHPGGKSFEVPAGDLPPNSGKTMKLECVTKLPGTHKISVQATAEGGLTSTDSVQTELLMPRLDLVLGGPKLRYVDRTAKYLLKVTNPSSATIQNVTLTTTVPPAFKFATASNNAQFDDATRVLTWNLGEFQSGHSREVNVDLVAMHDGDHRLVATLVGSRGVKSDAEIRTRVESLSALSLEVTDNEDPIEVGTEYAYEISLKNNGTRVEGNVELVCSIPEQVEFRNATCSAGVRHRLEGSDLIFEPIPRVAQRADVIYRVVVRGKFAANVTFRARLRADNLSGSESIVREERTRIYSDETLPK